MGLLFALLPVLGGTSGVLQGMLSMAKSYVFYFTGSSVKMSTISCFLFHLLYCCSVKPSF